MSNIVVALPIRLVERLREGSVTVKMVRAAVINVLAELAKEPPLPARMPAEDLADYVRRVALEKRGGMPPSLDEQFMNGLTLGEWLAMSDGQQQALWNKWEEEEWKKIEKDGRRGLNVILHTRAPRQERRAKIRLRAREDPAKYTLRRKRKSRIRSSKQ